MTDPLAAHVDEIDIDRAVNLERAIATTEQIKATNEQIEAATVAQTEVAKAQVKMLEARTMLRHFFGLAILVGIGIAIVAAVHFL